MIERSRVRTLAEETISDDHSFGLKNFWKGTVACDVILQMGGWIMRNDWLLNPSFMVYNKIRYCQLTEINVPEKSL